MSASGSHDVPRLLVVDSSVAVKWFKHDDEHSVDMALEILWQHQAGEVAIFAPGHLAAEVLNALQYAHFSLEQMRGAASALDGFGLDSVPLRRHLTEPAVEIARAHRLTINDALFAALAAQLDCELVTADRTQARVTECAVRLLR